MFGKKTESKAVEPVPSKDDQLGARPADVDPGPPLTYVVVLNNGLPEVEVKAHRHTFGNGRNDSDQGFTHFYLRLPSTWDQYSERDDRVVRWDNGRPVHEPYVKWTWVKRNHEIITFSIRTTDVLMVAEKSNVKGEEDVTADPS